MNQGDFVTIAVGLIIALQTVAVVNAIIAGMINPILSAIVGKNSFEQFGFDIGDVRISLGLVISALINFVAILAIVVLLLKAWNAMSAARPRTTSPTPSSASSRRSATT
jgi:large conductance mechanosensitive channel